MTEIDIPPILSSFQIRGLHGYKNVTLDFAGPARIVIAENGMGKTTILSTLEAVLTKRFSRLQYLKFEDIRCHFTSTDEVLILRKEDIPQQIRSGAEEKLRGLSKYTEIDILELQDIISEGEFDDTSAIRSTPILREIYFESPYSTEKILEDVLAIQFEIQQYRSEK